MPLVTVRNIFLLLALLFLTAVHFWALPHTTLNIVNSNLTKRAPIVLPDMQRGADDSNIYLLMWDYQASQQTVLEFLPRYCLRWIKAGDIHVPFNPAADCMDGEYQKKISVDFRGYLREGENIIFLGAHQRGMHMGAPVFHPSQPTPSDALGLGLLIALAAALAVHMRLYAGEWGSGFVLSASLLLCLWFFMNTGMMYNAIDMPAHLIYIYTLGMKNGFWPKPYHGWQFYQPPTYYSLQLLWMTLANRLRSFDAVSVMRCFDLACYAAFLIFSSLSLKRMLTHRVAYYAALSLLAFFPAGIVLSSHINNQLLYFALHAAAFYYLLRWLENHSGKDFGCMLVFTGLAIGTRSNILVFLPVITLACIWQWRRYGHLYDKRSALLWLGLIAILAGTGVNFGRNVYYRITEQRQESLLVGNLKDLPSNMKIEITAEQMLAFSPSSYFGREFIKIDPFEPENVYFLNYMLKTALFGQFEWQGTELALLLNALGLAMIAYMAASAFITRWEGRERDHGRLCLFVLLSSLLALMVNTMIHPYTSSQDFRYIYPALIAICGLYGLIVSCHLRQGKAVWGWLGIGLMTCFSANSIVFYAIQKG